MAYYLLLGAYSCFITGCGPLIHFSPGEGSSCEGTFASHQKNVVNFTRSDVAREVIECEHCHPESAASCREPACWTEARGREPAEPLQRRSSQR